MDGLIFAYHASHSNKQREFVSRRAAEIISQRHTEGPTPDKDKDKDRQVDLHIERAAAYYIPSQTILDANVPGASMTGLVDSIHSSSAEHADPSDLSFTSGPMEVREGRRYLRDVPYPLPVDVTEIQRQNLRTMLECTVFGQPVCSPVFKQRPPRKVLEIGCGGGYWSALCHRYFCSLGYKDVHFVGLDILPVAPDLRRQGVKWTFVQHDMRHHPCPFKDGEFDLIMLKDLSLIYPFIGTRSPLEKNLDECIRLLAPGGVLEIWDNEHVIRSILPHPPPLAGRQRKNQELAARTGTFLTAPGTPFTTAQNKYLSQANTWIERALDQRRLPASPCTRVAQILFQEADSLCGTDYRRIAIPLGESRWERDRNTQSSRGARKNAHDSVVFDDTSNGKSAYQGSGLTPDQHAVRQTALLCVVQFIESLEPLLRDVSSKNAEEWNHWWASMMTDLMDPHRGAVNGECLEIGAWWCTKTKQA